MKVIHINCIYPYGSTGKITEQIHHELLNRGHDSIVIYGRGKLCGEQNTIRICSDLKGKFNHLISRFTGLVYGGCGFETQKIISIIQRECPDIVHIQCINGYFVNIYKLITYLKTNKIKTVITLHAEFMYTANCACTFGCEKWKSGCGSCQNVYKATESLVGDKTKKSFLYMKNAFDGFEHYIKIVGVSDWLSERAKLSPIMNKLDINTIYNGIDTRCFEYRKENIIRQKLNISENEKMILWVTSGFTYDKGKDYLDQLIEVSQNNWKYIVVGAEKPDAYQGSARFLGKISEQYELADIYAASDIALCLSRQESYPTVLVEAQCCGTPVIGFDVGGVKETIRDDMGTTVPLGDVHLFVQLIEKWLNKKKNISLEKLLDIRKYFDKKRMTEEYMKLYEELLEKICV